MIQAPVGWTVTTLGELGRYLNGRAFKKSEWRGRGRPIIRIQNLTGSGESFNYFQGDLEDRYVARPGDLLVSWAATLGAFIWSGPEAVVNQHIFKVESNIDVRFHKYLLDYKLEELMRHTHGSGMVHITRGKFDSLPVSIPQRLEEQRRIVDILEDHLSRLDAAEASLGTAELRLGTLRRQVVAHALASVGGSSTTLGESAKQIKNGIFVSRAGTVPDGVPILRIGAVRPLALDTSDLRFSGISKKQLSAEDALVSAGEILFTRYNGNPRFVGACAVVPPGLGPLTYPDKLIRVRPATGVDPNFLTFLCTVGEGRQQIDAATKTTSGQAGISGRDLSDIKIRIPNLDSQQAAVRQAKQGLDGVQRLSAGVKRAMSGSRGLRQSLLAAAFSARLTGRSTDFDVADELASV